MGNINKGLFTSSKKDWETPDDLYDFLDNIFGFTLDPCASRANHKAAKYFTAKDDGIEKKWSGTVFMNPPYGRTDDGRTIADWIMKAYQESFSPDVDAVVCLIPARTDTRYWHDYVMKSQIVWLIKGRVKFSGAQSAPFPSAIVVFLGPEYNIHPPYIRGFDLKTMEVIPQ